MQSSYLNIFQQALQLELKSRYQKGKRNKQKVLMIVEVPSSFSLLPMFHKILQRLVLNRIQKLPERTYMYSCSSGSLSERTRRDNNGVYYVIIRVISFDPLSNSRLSAEISRGLEMGRKRVKIAGSNFEDQFDSTGVTK